MQKLNGESLHLVGLATKEQKLKDKSERLLPAKLQLKDWEQKLGLKEAELDSYNKMIT